MADDWGTMEDTDKADWDMDVTMEDALDDAPPADAFETDAKASWDDTVDSSAVDWTDDDSKMADEPTKPALSRHESYYVMDLNVLEKRAQKVVKQTAEVLFVDEDEAGCLLRHYGWKTAKLQADWFADDKKVRSAVGLVGKAAKPLPAMMQCQTAYCDVVPSSQGTALNCGHFFCDDCWRGYLESQVNSGRSCVFSRCLGIKCTKMGCVHKFGCTCDEMVPDRVFAKYLMPDLLAKYKRWVLSSFVEGERKIKWCPNPSCSRAVEYMPGGAKTVCCVCGYCFCFACCQQAHVPAPCDLVKKWLQREKSDDATETYLKARTKECPKCLVRIEKNKACNHMKCTNCGHDFCWLCKGEWKSHGSNTGGYYVCSKYDEEVSKGSLSSEEKSIQDNQRLLQKYNYYCNRYKSSQESIAMTQKLGEKLERSGMADLEANKCAFIADAIQRLIEARRVLQWTYSMAYYLQAGREKRLFEYQQELLINQTEGLQELMENTPVDQLSMKRKEIIDRTSTMEKFRREMVTQVEAGDFETLLLNEADTATNMWGCTACKSENKLDMDQCASCGACRTHGEQECKACRKKTK